MIEAAFKGARASHQHRPSLIHPPKQTRKKAAFMPKWDVEIPRPPAQQQECLQSLRTVEASGAEVYGPEAAKDVSEEPSPDDEKRRNYGGVYVGLPADLTTVAASQSKSTRKD